VVHRTDFSDHDELRIENLPISADTLSNAGILAKEM
jgi:hypothetical protein